MLEQPAPTYQGEEPFVFVSYSHQNEELVYREIRWLQDQDVNVWYDTQIPPDHRSIDTAAYDAYLRGLSLIGDQSLAGTLGIWYPDG